MNLEQLRNEIDSVDDQLVALLQKRLQLCRSVALYKAEHGAEVEDKMREKAILDRILADIDHNCREPVKSVYQAVFSASKSMQQTIIKEMNHD